MNATRIFDTEESKISAGGVLAGNGVAGRLVAKITMPRSRNPLATRIGLLRIWGEPRPDGTWGIQSFWLGQSWADRCSFFIESTELDVDYTAFSTGNQKIFHTSLKRFREAPHYPLCGNSGFRPDERKT